MSCHRELSREVVLRLIWQRGSLNPDACDNSLDAHDLALREKVQMLTKERDEARAAVAESDSLRSKAYSDRDEAVAVREDWKDISERWHAFSDRMCAELQRLRSDLEAEQNRNRSLWEENRRLIDEK